MPPGREGSCSGASSPGLSAESRGPGSPVLGSGPCGLGTGKRRMGKARTVQGAAAADEEGEGLTAWAQRCLLRAFLFQAARGEKEQ